MGLDAAAHNNLANLLAGTGNIAEAEKHFLRAIALDGGYANAHYNYGTALAAQARWADAERELRMAVKLDPSHIEEVKASIAKREAEEAAEPPSTKP